MSSPENRTEREPLQLRADFFRYLLSEKIDFETYKERFLVRYWVISLYRKGSFNPSEEETTKMREACLEEDQSWGETERALQILAARKPAHNCEMLAQMFCVFLDEQGIKSVVEIIPSAKQNHFGVRILSSGELISIWPEWEMLLCGRSRA